MSVGRLSFPWLLLVSFVRSVMAAAPPCAFKNGYLTPHKRKAKALEEAAAQDEIDETKTVSIQFQTVKGEVSGSQLEVPLNVTLEQLQELINQLLDNGEKLPYSFFLKEEEIVASLKETIRSGEMSTELVLPIIYQPQAIFRVRTVTRCSATIPGHTEAVLHVNFSPDGRQLATGSGDTTVRLWDVDTGTPYQTLNGHKNWVLAVAWSPNAKWIASGGMDSEVRVWMGNTEDSNKKMKCKALTGHKKWITALAWEPMISNADCNRLASASKDGVIKIWDTVKGQCLLTLGGHTSAVKDLKWGGQGLLYSASQDRTIKVWELVQGKCVRSLDGHAHWVNNLSLNTEYILRAGPFEYNGACPESKEDRVAACKTKYEKVLADNGGQELMVSGSDDFTLFLWDPVNSKKPIIRMTGHQQPVNFVCYSPDGRFIASASFDTSVRLWHGTTGKFIATLRGHVQSVYQVCWSADSRLLCSGSKDSTMKIWDRVTKKLKKDLPGHADEVFAVDWSPNGIIVASGGKDKLVKLWRN